MKRGSRTVEVLGFRAAAAHQDAADTFELTPGTTWERAEKKLFTVPAHVHRADSRGDLSFLLIFFFFPFSL